MLSRYDVTRVISRGRHATVLQAIDREGSHTVALKVFDVDDAASMARPWSEAPVLLDLAIEQVGDYF
jgi:hypothetical protein